MTTSRSRALTATATILAIGIGFALFGLAIDFADRIFPFQGRPAFASATTSAWFSASLVRFVTGATIGLIWNLQQRVADGIGRRLTGFLLFFMAAALLRGSLAAWLNAPVEHIVVALGIGLVAGVVAFAIAEVGRMTQHPPPPARIG